MTRAVKPAAGISIFLPLRSKARTTMFLARGTRPRISGMLRHPSQSSTVSRDANPRVFLHRLEHVVDELLDPGSTDFRRVQRPGFRAQDRVPHARDLQNRHTWQLYDPRASPFIARTAAAGTN